MTLAAKLASVFGYQVAPTALLAFISYFSIFIALFVTDLLPNVPSPRKLGGLDLKEAYEDLRHVSWQLCHLYMYFSFNSLTDYSTSTSLQLARKRRCPGLHPLPT